MSKKKDLKIIGLPVGEDGCSWYRVRQPLNMVKAFTSSDTHIIDKDKDDMVQVAKALQLADVVVTRPGAENGLKASSDKSIPIGIIRLAGLPSGPRNI